MPRLKEGTRVRLITVMHGNGPGNPVWGGKYGCEGILGYQGHLEYIYQVLWDNGKNNEYTEGDLQEVKPEYISPFAMEEVSSLWTV
jgi:hypothetical protein